MKRLRILIVEDDGMIAFLLGEVLKGMGHAICASEATEDDAIAAALRCRPDLMIVDENLGAGSGIAVVDAIVKNGPVPHLFVTGDLMRIKKRRPDAIVIQKPYFENDLARAIQQAIMPDMPLSPQPHGSSTGRGAATPGSSSGVGERP